MTHCMLAFISWRLHYPYIIVHCETNRDRFDCVSSQVKKNPSLLRECSHCISFFHGGHFCLAISNSMPEDLMETMDQYWA